MGIGCRILQGAQDPYLYQSPVGVPYTGIAISNPFEPTSPLDDGLGFDPCNPLPISVYVEVKCNPCECCTYIYGSFLYMSTAPQIICVSNGGNCGTPPPSPPVLPPPSIPPIPPIPKGCRMKPMATLTYKAAEAWAKPIREYNEQVQANNGDFEEYLYPFSGIDLGWSAAYGTNQIPHFSNPALIPLEPDNGEGVSYDNYYHGSVASVRGEIDDLLESSGVWTVSYEGTNSLGEPILVAQELISSPSYSWHFVIACGSAPNQPPPSNNNGSGSPKPKPTYDNGDNDMACCPETNQLLREILKRIGTPANKSIAGNLTGGGSTQTPTLTDIAYEFPKLLAEKIGTGELPASVPASLQGTDSTSIKIDNLAAFQSYLIEQLDALIGEFPVKVEIEDIDPATKGNQSQTLEIPNIAEGLAEIFGMGARSTINSEAILNLLVRTATEVIATKNAAIIAQEYAMGNADYLGYKGNVVQRKVNYALDFTKAADKPPEDVAELLQEIEGSLNGWQNTDRDTLSRALKDLRFAAGIIKATSFRGKKDAARLNKELSESIDPSLDADNDDKWKEYLNTMNTDGSLFNKESITKPEIKEQKDIFS